jgi:hypothetical protein
MVIAQYFFITITSSPTDTTAAFTKTAAFTHCTAKTAKLATTPATPLPQRTRSQTRGRRLPLTALALALITLLPVTLLGLWQVHQLSGSAAQPHSASTRSSAAHMLPTLFLPHGGGPLPVLGDHGHTGKCGEPVQRARCPVHTLMASLSVPDKPLHKPLQPSRPS